MLNNPDDDEFVRDVAELCNGGKWEKDYTEEQKQFWRDLVRKNQNISDLKSEIEKRTHALK